MTVTMPKGAFDSLADEADENNSGDASHHNEADSLSRLRGRARRIVRKPHPPVESELACLALSPFAL